MSAAPAAPENRTQSAPSPAGDAATPPAQPGAGACPRCGTAFAPLQEYCLECGLRLPLARGIVTQLGTAWRRRLRWYPGDWLWPALLFLVISALGASVAILSSTRDEGRKTLVAIPPPAQPPQTTPVGSTEATVPTATGETGTTAVPPSPQPPASPPSPPSPPAAPVEWPAGQAGYTVVLASVPTTDGRAAAEEQAERAIDAGLTDVGVLESSSYSSLHPGYYVVFTGIRDSFADTQADIESAHAGGYPKAYQRQITP